MGESSEHSRATLDVVATTSSATWAKASWIWATAAALTQPKHLTMRICTNSSRLAPTQSSSRPRGTNKTVSRCTCPLRPKTIFRLSRQWRSTWAPLCPPNALISTKLARLDQAQSIIILGNSTLTTQECPKFHSQWPLIRCALSSSKRSTITCSRTR